MKVPHKKFLQESLQSLCLIKISLTYNTSIVSIQQSKLPLHGMRASLYRNRGGTGTFGEGRVSLSKLRHIDEIELKRGDTSLELGATTQDMVPPFNITMSSTNERGPPHVKCAQERGVCPPSLGIVTLSSKSCQVCFLTQREVYLLTWLTPKCL